MVSLCVLPQSVMVQADVHFAIYCNSCTMQTYHYCHHYDIHDTCHNALPDAMQHRHSNV